MLYAAVAASCLTHTVNVLCAAATCGSSGHSRRNTAVEDHGTLQQTCRERGSAIATDFWRCLSRFGRRWTARVIRWSRELHVQASLSRTADTTDVFDGGWRRCAYQSLRVTQRQCLLSRSWWRGRERLRSGVRQQRTTGATAKCHRGVLRRHVQSGTHNISPALHAVRSVRRRCVSSRLRHHVAQDAGIYTKVFEKVCNLVPQLAPTCAIADFEEASMSAFHDVFGNVSVTWLLVPLHTGLDKACEQKRHEGGLHTWPRSWECCSLPQELALLRPSAIADVVSEVHAQLDADSQHASRLQQLIVYVNRQCINKRSIGPERMSVRNNRVAPTMY